MNTQVRSEELERECASDLLSNIITETDKQERYLQWYRITDGVYTADLKGACTLTFIIQYPLRGLYVRDNADFHEPFVLYPHVYGRPMIDLFGKLETAIILQMGRHPNLNKPITTKIDFLRYAQKCL